MEENMVCATIHAQHAPTTATIRAYLAAHRPDRISSFVITAPSADMEEWCERALVNADVSVRKSARMRLVGTAPGQVWTKLLREHGQLMNTCSILLFSRSPEYHLLKYISKLITKCRLAFKRENAVSPFGILFGILLGSVFQINCNCDDHSD